MYKPIQFTNMYIFTDCFTYQISSISIESKIPVKDRQFQRQKYCLCPVLGISLLKKLV